MIDVLTKRRWQPVTVATGLVLTAIVALAAIRSSQDNKEVSLMTANMKTQCVGRFLVDVPSGSRIAFRGAFLSGWNIRINPFESDLQFAARLRGKETELANKKNERGGQNVETAISVNNAGVVGKILLHSRTWVRGREGGKPKEFTGASLDAHLRSNNVSVDFTSDVHDTEDVEELVRLAKQIRILEENEIPARAGFCFGRMMIEDPLIPSQNERVTMFASLEGHPDMAFAFDTSAGLTPAETLLARHNQNDIRQEFPLLFHTFRAGDRTVAGLAGQEVAERIREFNGKATHDFTWESFSDEKDVYRPLVSIELSSGHPARQGGRPAGASLSDEAMLLLWDKILASVRVRRGANDRPPSTLQPTP